MDLGKRCGYLVDGDLLRGAGDKGFGICCNDGALICFGQGSDFGGRVVFGRVFTGSIGELVDLFVQGVVKGIEIGGLL